MGGIPVLDSPALSRLCIYVKIGRCRGGKRISALCMHAGKRRPVREAEERRVCVHCRANKIIQGFCVRVSVCQKL